MFAKVATAIGILALLMGLSASARGQPAGAPAARPSSAAPPAAKSDQEMYRTVLESVQKTAQSAIETTKDTARSAIEASQAANNTLQIVFGLGATLVAGVVAVLGFVGFKSIRELKAAYGKAISAMQDKAASDLKSVVDRTVADISSRGEELIRKAANEHAVHVEITRCLTYWNHNAVKATTMVDRSVAERLQDELIRIVELGTSVGDIRARSYANAELGVLAFKLGEFRRAVDFFRKSLEDGAGAQRVWPDRHYNLACALEVCYVREGAREPALRDDAVQQLTKYHGIHPEGAVTVLRDADFRRLLDETPVVRDMFFAAARETMSKRSANDPTTAAGYLADTQLGWVFEALPALRKDLERQP